MEYLQVKNWSRFQHYKHRKPPWIRLYRDLLDDHEFYSLPIASKALAPMIWLLASDTVEGKIEYDLAQISFRLRMSCTDFESALKPLLDKGFVSLASKVIATRLQRAIPEGETERESEAEKTRASRVSRNRFDEEEEQRRKLKAQADRIMREHDLNVALRVGSGPEVTRR